MSCALYELIRSPTFCLKSLPTAERSKKKFMWRFVSRADKEPKKTCTSGGLLISSCFLRAPHQLMKCFSLQNGRFGLTFAKVSKGFRRKVRAPYQLFGFRRKKKISPNVGKIGSVPQKENISKVCQKFDKLHSAHPAETMNFSRGDAKKRSVPQKNSFFQNFSKFGRKIRK